MHDETVPVLVNAADRPLRVRDALNELAASTHLLANLVRRDLTVRYKRSILGFLWTMLNPLLLMIIMTLVFSHIFRFEGLVHYEIYFLSEFLVWNFFAQTTVNSMASLAWNGALMKRVRVPKAVFALSTTISGLVNLGLACVPLLLIMLAVGAPITPAILFVPVGFLLIGLFTLGMSLLLSALAVYFDDVVHMYQVATLAWMYLTPIIYPITIIPESSRWIILINPLTHLFKLARDPIWRGVLPSPEVLVGSIVVSLVTVVVGAVVFNRLSRGFYLHL